MQDRIKCAECAGRTFFKNYCTFFRQAIVKTGKKGPNKDVQDGFFPKKNKVCCTIIWQVKVLEYVLGKADPNVIFFLVFLAVSAF